MRTIVITIQTDSEADLEELECDLRQEIGCCTTLFDLDTMTVEER